MSGRKMISVFMACVFAVLSFSAAQAAGEIGWKDARLDAAFAAGSITLREVPLAGISLTLEDLVLPEEYENALKENMVEAADWLDSLYVLSVSPTGNSALLTDGQMLIAWNGGKARIVQPNLTRGAADTYGSFLKIWQHQPISAMFRPSFPNIAWSPDGRYAALTNYRNVIVNMRLDNDPHLIDTETGDVFLVAAYDVKLKFTNSAAASPVSACFSRDGRYAYYMLYGKIGTARTTLLRYDLQNGGTETCCSASDLDYYPSLWELQDGSLMILRDVNPNYRTTMAHSGLARYMETGSGWMSFSQPLPLEAVYNYTNQLVYSDASGYALLNTRVRYQNAMAFQCFRPDRDYAGLDQYWAFASENGKAVKLTQDEIRGLYQKPESEADPLDAYEFIVCMSLSPDGRYAMFQTVSKAGKSTVMHLRLVRLSDMSAVEVTGIDAEELRVLPAERSMIAWNGDAVLIALKSGLKTFMIE